MKRRIEKSSKKSLRLKFQLRITRIAIETILHPVVTHARNRCIDAASGFDKQFPFLSSNSSNTNIGVGRSRVDFIDGTLRFVSVNRARSGGTWLSGWLCPIAERLPSAMHDTLGVSLNLPRFCQAGVVMWQRRLCIYIYRGKARGKEACGTAHVQRTKRRSRAGPSLKDDRSLELDNFAEVATVCLRRDYGIG